MHYYLFKYNFIIYLKMGIEIDKNYYEVIEDILNLSLNEFKIIIETGKINNKILNEYFTINNNSFEDKILNDEKINILKKQIETLEKENQIQKIELENNNDILKKQIDELKNKIFEEKEKMFNNFEIKFNEEKDFMKNLLDKEINEKNNIINNFNNVLKDKDNYYNNNILNLKNEINDYKKKLEKYNNLQINSVLKGKPFEEYIEKELNDYIENNLNNIWELKNRSNEIGKGDYLLINKYSNFRIMLEIKNNKTIVSATVYEQLPKFYNDIENTINNYDAGLMISSGRIQGKKNYEIENINNKICGYLQNYKLNNPEHIMFMIELIHNKINDIKKKDNIIISDIIEYEKKEYIIIKNSVNTKKRDYENMLKLLENKKKFILETFNIDIDEILNQNNYNKNKFSLEDDIKNTFLKYKDEKFEKIKDIIYNKYQDEIKLFNLDKKKGISKRKITIILKNLYEN